MPASVLAPRAGEDRCYHVRRPRRIRYSTFEGFAGVVDLLKTAKHGPGRRVFLIQFRYEKPEHVRGSVT
jgi:hypothetical protein